MSEAEPLARLAALADAALAVARAREPRSVSLTTARWRWSCGTCLDQPVVLQSKVGRPPACACELLRQHRHDHP
jgi:hypothetical protein